MDVLNKYLGWLFLAIIVGIVLTNPRGVAAVLSGFAEFSEKTVRAFAPGGFAGRA